ncbi:MAG: hypothetical protein KDC00_11140 [Flavobacteriales bacterium]|nr:hypothetical protein [Flavobacteriales bacterium]
MVDVPYRIGSAGTPVHELDLRDLGNRKEVHMATVGSLQGEMRSYGFQADVKAEDYDRQFREKLRKLKPPQRVRDLLEHHHIFSVQRGGRPVEFLDHIRYNVIHQLEQHYANTPNTAVARDWYTKAMDKHHKQNLNDRARFLSAAYAYAVEQKPERPTLQAVHHTFLMEQLGFDAPKCERLRDELAQDGLVQVLAGGQAFRVLDTGRRALEQVEAERMATITYNNINATNANVQVQNHSPHATQTATLGDQLAEARAFAERVTAKLDEIEQLITAEQFVSLKADLEYLKAKLDEPVPRLPLITMLAQGIATGLPSELLGALAGSLLGG